MKILINNNIDLILVDTQILDIDGFDFIKILEKNLKTKNIPIIFIIVISEIEIYEVRAIDYIIKPIDRNILNLKISKFIKKR